MEMVQESVGHSRRGVPVWNWSRRSRPRSAPPNGRGQRGSSRRARTTSWGSWDR